VVRARRFGWDRIAAETLEVALALVGSHGAPGRVGAERIPTA
jgi:hypothetical protein